MGGWSGGVYTRFRNWVTDKANSINPQASLFDQEDDGFAAGLNNCITKDGLNKPSSQMDFNGQNLIGVNLLTAAGVNVTGAALPANGIYLPAANTLGLTSNTTLRLKVDGSGAWTMTAPVAGVALSITGINNANSMLLVAGQTSAQSFGLEIDGGTTSADYGLAVKNAGGSATNFKVRGDGITQAIDQSNTLQDVGWRDCPVNPQSGGSGYTLVLGDRGKLVRMNGVAGQTVTIPANASVAFPDGTSIVIVNNTAGALSIAITTDALFLAGTASTGTRTLATNGVATITKSYSSTQWSISGAGVS